MDPLTLAFAEMLVIFLEIAPATLHRVLGVRERLILLCSPSEEKAVCCFPP